MAGVILAVVLAVALTLGIAGPGASPADARVARSGVALVATVDELDPSSTSTMVDDGITQNTLGEPLEVGGSSASDDRKIWAVVAGLVLVAVALTALTVRYWRQTRPAAAGPATGSTGRRARRDDETSDVDDLGSDIFVDDASSTE